MPSQAPPGNEQHFQPNPGADGARHPFLSGGGEMGALMRAHDWSRTSLGDPANWPQPLRTSVRLMLNTGHPMYIFWGADGACLYNDAYRVSIGTERHPHSLGRPAREVWDEIWHIIGEQIEQVMAGRGATWHVNQPVPTTRNGVLEDVYWTYSYSPIDDDSAPSGVGGVLVVCSETTAQVLAERRLSAQVQRQHRQFQQAPGFICILNGPEHVFEFVNDTYARLFGPRDYIGRSAREVFPDIIGQGFFELLDSVYNTGERELVSAAPVHLVGPDGKRSMHYLSFVYAPVLGEDGGVTGIFCEGQDVTEVHQAREAQEEQNRALQELATALAAADQNKTQFLAMLAHELRNPLAPIRNGLAVMRRSDDPGLVARTRQIIERQVSHMARLVDDLLDVARISGGKMAFRQEPLDLAEVLANAIEASTPMLEAGGHAFEAHIAEGPLPVLGDAVRIAQVVSNLLDNAAKYTPTGGHISLSAECRDGHVLVRIADTGIGLDAEHLEDVFDMFRQVDGRDVTRQNGGLGIGLTLVRRIVQLHGGAVHAHSDGLGQGATFTVRLPLAATDAAAAQEGDPTAASAQRGDAARVPPSATDDNASGHVAPNHGAPSYNASSHGAPSHGAPSHGAPSHGAPSHGAPSHDASSHDASSHDASSHDASSDDASSERLRVLVADDNTDAADTLAMMLELGGHQVRIVHDGAAAVREATAFQPDVAFLDIGMPDMSGYQLAGVLRNTPGLQHTVLVALTGWGAESDRQRAREAGFHHHLTKPADPDAIEAVLSTCVPRQVAPLPRSA